MVQRSARGLKVSNSFLMNGVSTLLLTLAELYGLI